MTRQKTKQRMARRMAKRRARIEWLAKHLREGWHLDCGFLVKYGESVSAPAEVMEGL